MKNFTLKLHFLLTFLLLATLGMAQDVYPTVGLIGTATPKGWDASTPLQLAAANDPHQWTLTLELKQGEAKFRANDSWDVNWGGSAFPAGTADRNGPNLQVPTTSYYTVTFNDVTGAYRFEALSPPAVYATVGLIGDATPAGWAASTALVKGADNHTWTLSKIVLGAGEVKFRANDNWDVSWGANSFPAGTASRNGSNLVVTPGEYAVTFNDITGEYFFKNLNPTVYTTVGIIGSATQKGWDESTPMRLAAAADPNTWTLTTFLQTGELKFRANDAWDVNWGGPEFPAGTGTRNGPNLQVTETSYYTIQFNDLTGAYRFAKLTPTAYATVGILGSATVGGWDTSTPLVKGADGHTWTLENAPLTAGEAKFRANNTWEVNWGGGEFPAGVAAPNGPNIPVTAGSYTITFNDVTREYNFQLTGGGGGGTPNSIVTLNPALPTADESVTIIYDASKGASGLLGASKVYLHSGVILAGPEGTGWSNVVGNWGQDDGLGEMSPVPGEPNKWQITLPSIRQYYGVAPGEPVFR